MAPDFNQTPRRDQPRSLPEVPAVQETDSAPVRGEVFEMAPVGAPARDAAPRKWGAGWFFAGVALLFCVYSLGAYVGQKSKAPAPLAFAAKESGHAALRVYIVGKVKKPGVYALPGGARVQDAIQKAGGAAPGADLGALNLADWAADGSKIEVPAKIVAPKTTPTPVVIVKEVFVTPPQNSPDDDEPPTSAAAPDADEPAAAVTTPARLARSATTKPKPGVPHAATKSGSASDNASPEYLRQHPVNLNTSSAAQLEILPGIGPAMSARIIAYRQENGGFKSVDDLDNVKGIGEKRLEKLRPLVLVK